LRSWRIATASLAVIACAFTLNLASHAEAAGSKTARPMITSKIDETKLVTLEGNTRSAARNSKNDRGPVADDFKLDGMQMLLKRSPEQQAAFDKIVEGLTSKGSPYYHKWLNNSEIAEFGPSQKDIATIKEWLEGHGFTVTGIQPSGMIVEFSGNAGMVRDAFHTEIHNLALKNGETHIANINDPQIPAALAGAIHGIVSLNNFFPHPLVQKLPPARIANDGTSIKSELGPTGDYTSTSGSSTYYAVVPGDVQKVYNIGPLYTAGYAGKGETIALIEDSNAYNTADWTTFESTFGLTSYGGTLTTVHPTGSTTCTNPGDIAGTDLEVELDIEYAAATAPAAALEIASCKDTSTTFGGLIAVENLTSATAVTPVMSISYGECEAENGATANAAYSTAYENAAAKGTSVFVSSGDESSRSCDADDDYATHGLNVSGFTSTPYNVSVGGTDFGDTYAGTNSTYWSSTNSSTYESAKSYIPEIPWNDSCASALIYGKEGYSAGYGTSGFCNSSTGEADYLTTASGSGGPSNCYSGKASVTGVGTTGTCKGQAKPSWQSVLGNPSDSVRDIPDVSLFAANGVWGHYIVICYTNKSEGGVACTGAPSTWVGVGGTSASSPMMAGIQAIVDEYTKAKQGNPNPTYYSLAKTEYGTSGSTTCNSTLGNGTASTCIFYDVTQGDNNVNCRKDGSTLYDCYLPSGTNGVGSTSTSSYSSTYTTGTGWDFATGLGSVNAYNLVTKW
jgi:subtilase family serine protease